MQQNEIVKNKIKELLDFASKQKFNNDEIKIIEKAALFGAKKHDGQLRKSGEPYIIHPIETAKILMTWHMDLYAVVTGILHDVLEDTHTTEEEIEKEFGNQVANLVRYVTKVSLMSKENRKMAPKDEVEKKYIIQVFLSMSHDIRGMIVKLADRFHNMKTIKYLKPEKQFQIATETLEIYSKVAGRLGMYRLKTDLQDISFAIINPEQYKETKIKMDKIISKNETNWKENIKQIKDILNSYSVEFDIKERLKGIYSTWEKIQKNYTIQDIHDIYAVRIIVTNNLDCYKVLGLIHLNFQFVKNAFKDYVSSPKLNYYQSIHTTIIKNKSLLEIQIRTKEMDVIAENGIAAHWSYKDKTSNLNSLSQPFNFINEVFKINELNNSLEEIKQITNDIVFDVLVLNDESKYVVNNRTRVIDLAFRFDKDNFKHLTSVWINGQQTSYDTILKSNDVIKFNYATSTKINKHWLKFTQLNITKIGINELLEQEKKQKIMNSTNFLKMIKEKLNTNYIGDKKLVLLIKKKFKKNNLQSFLDNITSEMYYDPDLINCFDKRKTIARNAIRKIVAKYGFLIFKAKEFYFKNIEGLYFTNLEFPICCNKIPGMDVIGKLGKNNILEVHNAHCPNVNKERSKTYPLTWDTEKLNGNARKFRYQIDFIADWTPSIGNIISKKLIWHHIVINELKIEKYKHNDTCKVHIVLYASNLQHVKSWYVELNQEINIKSNLNFN